MFFFRLAYGLQLGFLDRSASALTHRVPGHSGCGARWSHCRSLSAAAIVRNTESALMICAGHADQFGFDPQVVTERRARLSVTLNERGLESH